jgi:hypothetical protein
MAKKTIKISVPSNYEGKAETMVIPKERILHSRTQTFVGQTPDPVDPKVSRPHRTVRTYVKLTTGEEIETLTPIAQIETDLEAP